MSIRKFFEITGNQLILSLLAMASGIVIGIHGRTDTFDDFIKMIFPIAIVCVTLVVICSVISASIVEAICNRKEPRLVDRVYDMHKKGISIKDIAKKMNRDERQIELMIETAKMNEYLSEGIKENTPLAASEKGKRSPTIKERENVIMLYKRGWTAEQISKASNLSKAEVELIIEISG